jgi:kynurenine formamidase
VKVEETEKKQEEMKLVMQDAGVYDTVIIKAGWEKYRKDDPDLYDYTKAFYWTMLNFCDAYRVANTGALQTNVEHREDLM